MEGQPSTIFIISNSTETNGLTDLYHILPLLSLSDFKILYLRPLCDSNRIVIISNFTTLVDHLASFFSDVHPVSLASSTYLPESSVTIGVIS